MQRDHMPIISHSSCRMVRFSWIIILCLLLLRHATYADVQIPLNGTFTIYTSAKQQDPSYQALLALQRDIGKVTGSKIVIKDLSMVHSSGIVIVNSEKDKVLEKLSGWEAHSIYVKKIKGYEQIVLQGADLRGTIYAIYSFSEAVLKVPPLWYFINWKPENKQAMVVPSSFKLIIPPPVVKYRAIFPNDTDMFSSWRKLSDDNNELWLETALRLKFNTVEWFESGLMKRKNPKKYRISSTLLLLKKYGLIATTHHHSPVNASFHDWESYWKNLRDTIVPELSLANKRYIEEFWRYSIESVHRAGLDMIWTIGFRGAGDHPFWETFKDVPGSMEERGKVVSQMIEKQRELVIEITGNPHVQFRTIFYNELSDLMASGFLTPPADPDLIWNYVAARRDHFPNADVQKLQRSDRNLGYYFNYQFTSSGSHLVAGEGPWKMEQNYRYLSQKSTKPILFSVVNAGNIREFVMELSANAAMMWDFDQYTTDGFLLKFCETYYGEPYAKAIAGLYKDYYNAYWEQRKPDLTDFKRQYIFQDLRYWRALEFIAKATNKRKDDTPLKDIGGEQQAGRTYQIIPEDNNARNQVDAIINGTSSAAGKFLAAAEKYKEIAPHLNGYRKNFLFSNLGAPLYFMYDVNDALCQLTKAYKASEKSEEQYSYVRQSIASLTKAKEVLHQTQIPPFKTWYSTSRIFNLDRSINILNDVIN